MTGSVRGKSVWPNDNRYVYSINRYQGLRNWKKMLFWLNDWVILLSFHYCATNLKCFYKGTFIILFMKRYGFHIKLCLKCFKKSLMNMKKISFCTERNYHNYLQSFNSCANVNWARRMTCNVCNAPKYGKQEQRTGEYWTKQQKWLLLIYDIEYFPYSMKESSCWACSIHVNSASCRSLPLFYMLSHLLPLFK